jgi:hypothetical protein
MQRAYNLFEKILKDTETAQVLYTYLDTTVKPPLDYTDLLRWQWAQSVSALDKLIHDFVRIGMVKIFEGTRPMTDKYKSFTIDIQTYNQLNNNIAIASSIFEQQVLLKNGFLSFQDPAKISDALSYIWDEKHKWQKIAQQMNQDESLVKTTLKNIVIRRNQIVHEGDYSDTLLQRQEICEQDVIDVITFIKSLAQSIYALVK